MEIYIDLIGPSWVNDVSEWFAKKNIWMRGRFMGKHLFNCLHIVQYIHKLYADSTDEAHIINKHKCYFVAFYVDFINSQALFAYTTGKKSQFTMWLQIDTCLHTKKRSIQCKRVLCVLPFVQAFTHKAYLIPNCIQFGFNMQTITIDIPLELLCKFHNLWTIENNCESIPILFILF